MEIAVKIPLRKTFDNILRWLEPRDGFPQPPPPSFRYFTWYLRTRLVGIRFIKPRKREKVSEIDPKRPRPQFFSYRVIPLKVQDGVGSFGIL